MALLHGPPGTGKTSLCRALANELAIRLTGEETSGFQQVGELTVLDLDICQGLLVEISSHSLSSKWMGESGKLVERMFDVVREHVAEASNFVVVLIDEVESLTSARKSVSSGLECSDSLRAVNALLVKNSLLFLSSLPQTQLDSIKIHPNVLILATSNLTGSIDLAFVDRADIKQYVGLPPAAAILTMLQSAVQVKQELKLKPVSKIHISGAAVQEGDLRAAGGGEDGAGSAEGCGSPLLPARFLRCWFLPQHSSLSSAKAALSGSCPSWPCVWGRGGAWAPSWRV